MTQSFARVLLLAVAYAVLGAAINVDPAMECAFCHVSLGMVIETEVQIKYIGNMKKEKCASMGKLEKKACEWAIDEASYAVLKKAKPEEVCAKVGMCKAPFDSCSLYSVWPVKDLPPQPISWPVERRNLGELSDLNEVLDSFIQKVKAVIALHQEHQQQPIQASREEGGFYSFWPQLLQMRATLKAILDGSTIESLASKDSNGCSLFDVKCKGTNVANHLPFSDADGDSFSTKKELRGSDWRGVDCNDKNPDIHPGRATLPAGVAPDVDHNCNGIAGTNGTSTYEELFCTGANAPRPLIALGDSATAHFHLPPQWFTAEGWNLDGLQRVIEGKFSST
jgi:hypothetical protein